MYLVALDPVVGSELAKTRPAAIIQNDVGNRFSDTTIIAPLSSKSEGKLYPTEVLVRAPEGGLQVDSVVRLDNIRVVDKSRLGRRLGTLRPATMATVDEAIGISLGLIPLS